VARFRPSAYDPRSDSSPGTEAWRPGHKNNPGGLEGVILDWRTLPAPNDHLRPCPCGCRKPITGSRSRFVVGHDARLKGILTRAFITASPVHLLHDGTGSSTKLGGLARVETATASDVASKFSSDTYDWTVGLAAAADKVGGKLEDRLLATDRRVLHNSLNPLGGRALLHCGRWEKTGHLLAVYVGPDLQHYYEWTASDGELRTHTGANPETDPTEDEGEE
jgi:hypothetical protein